MRFIRQSLAILLAVHCCIAAASPSSNEFEKCDRMASSVRMQCLANKGGDQHDECLDQSRQISDACYAEVKKMHQPDLARIEAQRQAMQEYLQREEVQRNQRRSKYR